MWCTNLQQLAGDRGACYDGRCTETVLVQPFFFVDRICDVISWGNTGVNDLFVNVACFDTSGAPANDQFSVLVIQ